MDHPLPRYVDGVNKPKCYLGGGVETCALRKSTSPCLLAIPAFDRIAGLYNSHPNSNGEYANANDFGVRLKAMTDLAKNKCLVGPGLNMGGLNFGWLSVWVLSPDWLIRNLEICDYCQALR